MNLHVTILGSGAATPRLGRHCSAQVISVNGFKALMDCGEGTQNQIRAYHQKMQAMSHIFVSHLHGDHIFGLPGLLSSMHLGGRQTDVDIYSPPGLQAGLEPLFRYSESHIDYPLHFHEIELQGNEEQVVLENHQCRVVAFPLHHTVPCLGYRFEENFSQQNTNHRRMRYAYCCDTAFNESILPHIEGVDLLCVECTYDTSLEALGLERGHCTAAQAALLAHKAGAKHLLLTHFSARYHDTQLLLDEARAIFPLTHEASDGLHIDVDQLVKQYLPQ